MSSNITLHSTTENEDEVTPPPDPKCASELEYTIKRSRQLSSILTLCRGLKDREGKHIISLDQDPFTHIKLARSVAPKAITFKDEVVRRWTQFKDEGLLAPNATQPQPKNWNIERCEKWMDENPIKNPHDVFFLTKTAQAVKSQALLTLKNKEAEKRLLEKSWVGKQPWLRLIHSLVDHDDIKLLYLRRNDVPTSRMAVENRNSTNNRPKSVWERLAEKWNDPQYIVQTAAIPGLHSDFVQSEVIAHFQVCDMLPAMAEKCEGKFSNMVVTMMRIIQKWEQSGQGDGGFDIGGDASSRCSWV
jgi:hypothetical protein